MTLDPGSKVQKEIESLSSYRAVSPSLLQAQQQSCVCGQRTEAMCLKGEEAVLRDEGVPSTPRRSPIS